MSSNIIVVKYVINFRIALSIVVLVSFAGRLPAQNTAIIDSLRHRADQASGDSARVHEYVELSKTIVATDIEEALQVAQQAMDVAEKSGD